MNRTSLLESEHKGNCSVASFEQQLDSGYKVTLVATTANLQRRSFSSPVVAADGRYKFTIMGWPVRVWAL